MYLINVYVWEVLVLFVHVVVSQRLVYGFWAPILHRNQISNWNHITGAGPQPAEPISRCSIFLFYLASLLCLFIYLSIYPYLSSALRDHHRPFERAWVTHTSLRCASITTDASCTRSRPHPHYSTLGFSRLINDLGDLVRLGTFALKWSTFLLFHRAWALPKGMPSSLFFSPLRIFVEVTESRGTLHVDRVRKKKSVFRFQGCKTASRRQEEWRRSIYVHSNDIRSRSLSLA